MANSYRELNSPELVTWFQRLTKGYIHKGRDPHMMSDYIKRTGVSPTQVLLGIFEFRNSESTKDIPTFLRGDWPLGDDLLLDEAELVLHLTGQPAPMFYITYCDLVDLDMASAQFERAFQEAKQKLQEWVDDHLNRPAPTNRGDRFQRSPAAPSRPRKGTSS